MDHHASTFCNALKYPSFYAVSKMNKKTKSTCINNHIFINIIGENISRKLQLLLTDWAHWYTVVCTVHALHGPPAENDLYIFTTISTYITKDRGMKQITEQLTYARRISTGMYTKHSCVTIWVIVSRCIVYPVKPATKQQSNQNAFQFKAYHPWTFLFPRPYFLRPWTQNLSMT